MDFSIFCAQREQTEFPSDQEHKWNWNISTTSWITNELEEANQSCEIAFLGFNGKDGVILNPFIVQPAYDLRHGQDLRWAFVREGLDFFYFLTDFHELVAVIIILVVVRVDFVDVQRISFWKTERAFGTHERWMSSTKRKHFVFIGLSEVYIESEKVESLQKYLLRPFNREDFFEYALKVHDPGIENMLIGHVVVRQKIWCCCMIAHLLRLVWIQQLCQWTVRVQFVQDWWDYQLRFGLLFNQVLVVVNVQRLYLRFGSLEMDAEVSVVNIVDIVELSWSLWHLAWLTHVGAVHSLQCWTSADYAWLLVHVSVHLLVSYRTAVQQVIVGIWVIDHVSWFYLHTLSNSGGIPSARSTSHWCHLTSSCILSGRRLIDIVDLLLPVARHGHVKLTPSILLHLLILENIAPYILIDANLAHANLFIFFFCLRFIDLICQHEVRKFSQRKVRLALEVDIEYVFENHWVGVELTQEQVLVLSAFPHEFLLNINVEVCLDRVHVESRIGWRCSDNVV